MITLAPSAAIPPRYVNRHCLITGQTGTGKTVTLMKYAESLAHAGVSVFAADVKGDLSALARSTNARRLDMLGGHAQVPIWAMGPDLLARAMELTDTQTATLEIVFSHAADAPLDTLDDLRAALACVLQDRQEVRATLGQVSPASIGVIQRGILRLENMGAAQFFGPNRFDVENLLKPGAVTILDATRLFETPRLYGAFLLWLMRELWQRMPECGDQPAARLALFFDEAHTVFSEAGPALLRQTEQTARLIRSRGVGLVWASQSPNDVPDLIRDQCATRIAHDRTLGVGRAQFVTLSQYGRPTAPHIIAPALPDCGLAPARLPEMTHSPATDTAPPPQDMTATGYAFLAIMGATCLAIVGAVLTWGDAINWTYAGGLAIGAALVLKGRAAS